MTYYDGGHPCYRRWYEKIKTIFLDIAFLSDRSGWMRRYWIRTKPDFYPDLKPNIYPDQYPDADPPDSDTGPDSRSV